MDQPMTSSEMNKHNYDYELTWKHPSHTFQRLLALFSMCFIGFGSHFCFDNPGALQDNFLKDLNLSTSQFVYLYSWYSWPNVLMCFFGGFLINRFFGIRLGTVIYAFLVVLGQLVFAAGVYFKIFWVMLLGRVIFGIGGESLTVAQNNYAVLWFEGKELITVFGLQLSFARVGSFVNFIVMEPLYQYIKNHHNISNFQSLSIVLFIASLTCVMSLLCSLLLAWQDERAEKLLHRRVPDAIEFVKLTDVQNSPRKFWLVTFIILCYYTSVLPFVALGKVFFERKYKFSPNAASFVNGIIYLISAIFAPVLGLVINRTGRNLFWVFLSILGTLVSHMFLAFTFFNPYIAMIMMGLCYSILANALWPVIAMIIPENQMGAAYNIAQSIENLGLAVVAILTGIVVDEEGYYMMELFFCFLLSVSLLLTAILWTWDSRKNGNLNMSIKQRSELESNKTLLNDNDAYVED